MNPLASLIAERIHRFGPITFAEYMRECLYHPVHGYYSQPEARRFADYYTSVDVHPIFGRLLARQFAEMWEQMDRPAEFVLVEAGAGTGRLARQILEFARTTLPEFYGAVRYVAVERSPGRCDQIANESSGICSGREVPGIGGDSRACECGMRVFERIARCASGASGGAAGRQTSGNFRHG